MFVRSAEAFGVKWMLRVCETVLPCLLLFFFTSTALQAMEPSEQQAAQSRLEEAFKKLDLDGNQQLTEEEYLAQAGDQKVLKRDFLIFDLDEDGSLSLVEFSLTPGVIPAKYRVGIADPIDLYRDNAKKMFHEWAKPQLQGKASRGESFSGTSPGYAPSSVVQFFNGSPNQFPPIGSVSANQHFKYFDKDSDGVLSPEELENFLDIMVGKRMLSGFLFRHENGLVVRYGNFIRHDQNRDGNITLEEFLALNPQENAKEEFQQADTNQNGSLSLGEFSVVPGLGLADPIADFRAADEDLDGFLSAKELKQSLPEAMHDLLPHTFHAFAQSQPGKLSLSEYRLSPFGNDITVWETPLRDSNGDGELSFDELRFPGMHARYYMYLFLSLHDRDASGKLTQYEYKFKLTPHQTFHRMTLDGKDFQQIFVNPKYAKCGSPAISPDSQSIICDNFPISGIRQSRLYLMDIDGKNAVDVCRGLMPSWNHDGTLFATTRYDGLFIVDREGNDVSRFANGWGAQWSPDGRYIAFVSCGNEMWVYDVQKEKSHCILSSKQHPYRHLFFNMAWSPDSQRLLFKAFAEKETASDLVSIKVEGGEPDLKVHLSNEKSMDADVCWHPDGKQAFVSRVAGELPRRQLYIINLETNEIRLMDGIDPALAYGGISASPDKKWLVICTYPQN